MCIKRKICIVTGTRAEYGLLYWLMKEMQTDLGIEIQIIATGMHLSPEFGLTYRSIEQDGFSINEKVEMLLSSDTPVGIGKSMGLATIGFADALYRLRPDILVLLGDRYEILAAAQAAMVARIPIAHIHGGEATEGLIDEAVRHAVTKMAHFHFVAAEPYRKRVIQLGENPERVWNVGALGLDSVKKLKLLNRDELEKSINFNFSQVNFLVTYHPVTLNSIGPEQEMEALFQALDYFSDAHVIFTKPNADTNGRAIIKMIDDYANKQPHRVKSYTSLGQLKYLSCVQHIDAVIGNSSSGIIEVPAFGKPSVNIGERQMGRLKALSVIDCDKNAESIIAAMKKALSLNFQHGLQNISLPYGMGHAAVKIKDVLKDIELCGVLKKKFYDLV